jgi:transcription antitermination factor NusG
METSTEIDTLDTPVIGTDDREARSFHWYAARTQMNCERKLEKEFKALSVETYLPMQEEVHQWNDRKKKVQRLVIPMILFVRLTHEHALKLNLQKRFFYGFLGVDRSNRIPAKISNSEIETLRYMLGDSSSKVHFDLTFDSLNNCKGKKITISRGYLKGYEGYFIKQQDDKIYLNVAIGTLGYATVEVKSTDVI